MNILAYRKYRLRGWEHTTLDREVELSVASYEKNLLWSWTLEILTGDLSYRDFQDGFTAMQREVLERLHERWKQGDNVLIVDADTLCVRPTEIFGRFDRMVIPWGGRSCSGERHNPILNIGVVYIPATTSAAAWDVGLTAMKHCPMYWGADQEALNDMVRVDGPPILAPELNWGISQDEQNPLREEQAHIIHFHRTRGGSVPEAMRAALERLT